MTSLNTNSGRKKGIETIKESGYLLSNIHLDEELKDSFNNKLSLFCRSKNFFDRTSGEAFRECFACMKDYCLTCFSACHPNGTCSETTREMEDETIYEFASTCHCDHNLEVKYASELHLPCFYTKFLSENLSNSKPEFNMLVKENTVTCAFCEKNCELPIQNDQKLINPNSNISNYITCSCSDIRHRSFDLLDLMTLFRIAYSSNSDRIIQYKEVIPKLREELDLHFNDIQNKNLRKELIEYHLFIFTAHNIIYNVKFNISFSEEVELIMDLAGNKRYFIDNNFHKREKINIPLTYFLHFHKKYFFSKMQVINIKNINFLTFEERVEIMKKNSKFIKLIQRKSIPKIVVELGDFILFQKQFFINLFNELKDKKDFLIRMSNEERDIPFLPYLRNLLYGSFFIIEGETFELFDIPLDIFQFKNKYNLYNNLIRKYIDEAIYISQITFIDLAIKLSSSMLDEKKLTKFIQLFFLNLNYQGSIEMFNKYLSFMFYNSCDTYLLKSIKNNQLVSDESDERDLFENLRVVPHEKLFYFDCFNMKFISEITERIWKSELDHLIDKDKNIKDVEDEIRQRKTENPQIGYEEREGDDLIENQVEKIISNGEETQPNKKHFVFFKNLAVEYIYRHKDQNKVFNLYIDLILEKFDLNIDSEMINNQTGLIDYLFDSLKSTEQKTENLSSYKIDISQFLNKKKMINISEVDLKPFEEEIKFILYKFFNLEFHKNQESSESIFKWNLLLFLFFCNENNAIFILTKIKFLDFLLQSKRHTKMKIKSKSFLIDSLTSDYENVKDYNYIWKIFYISFNNYINQCEHLGYLKLLIFEKFVNVVTDFYYSQNEDKREHFSDPLNKRMNFTLVYYFLKITKKLLILNNLNSCLPYNFNVNKFEVVQKINKLAYWVFETTPFNINKYFDAIKFFNRVSESEYSINTVADEKKNPNITDESYDETDGLKIEIVNVNITYEQKKENKLRTNKEIQIESVQLSILDILGGFYFTSDINVYFKIINQNMNEFRYFFENKKEFKTANEQLTNKIFRVEIILIKFLLNFVQLNVYDFSKISLSSEKTITEEELNKFGNTILKEGKNIGIDIDINKNSFLSKYLLTKMKIKVLDEIGVYIENFERNFYPKRRHNKLIELYLANYFSLIPRDLLTEVNTINEKQVIGLKRQYAQFLITFFKKFPIQYHAFKLRGKEYVEILVKKTLKISDVINCKEESIRDIKRNLVEIVKNSYMSEKDIKYCKKLNINYLGFDEINEEYFENFVSYDKRLHSKYSRQINDFILDKIKLRKRVQELKKKLVIYLLENHSNWKPKNKKGEEDNNNYGPSFKLYVEKYIYGPNIFNFWSSLNEKFSKQDSSDVNHLIEYLFNSLDILQESNEKNIDNLFSENVIKIIDFLNNLLYHNPMNILDIVLKHVNERRMKYLLRNVLKLNNYIIGISDYENNERLMSLSKIYFTMMDFFILLQEGMKSEKLASYFFMDLSDPEEKNSNDQTSDINEYSDKNIKTNNPNQISNDYNSLLHKKPKLLEDNINIDQKEDEKTKNKANDLNENDKDLNKKEKKDNYEDNFYFYTFLQLMDITRRIEYATYSKEFSYGSFRLFLQFLYINRFLKEYLEIEDLPENLRKKEIINHCFLSHFRLNYIISLDSEYSVILRYELVNLLNVYLEENYQSSAGKILNNFALNNINYKVIFLEIKKCFEPIITKFNHRKNICDPKIENLKNDFLFNNYIEEYYIFSESKYFHLAESLYRLLRLINPFYEDLAYSFKKEINDYNEGWLEMKEFMSSYKGKETTYSKQEDNYRQFLKIFFDFMMDIGKEIEVKFQESNGKFIFRKLYFFINYKCFFHDQSHKEKFMEKTPRTTLGEKLNYFNKKLDKFLLNIRTNKEFGYVNEKVSKNFQMQSVLQYINTINFILIFILNILLLIYCFDDSSQKSFKEDLNSQMFLFTDSPGILEKYTYVFYTAMVFLLFQIGLIAFWVYYRFTVEFMIRGYKSILDEKYLLSKNMNEKEFKSKSFEIYDMISTKFDGSVENRFDPYYNKKCTFWNLTLLKFKVIIKSDIFYPLFSFIFNLLFLITNYKLLLVIPIVSITKLYALFDYFLTAIRSKYKEFVALLIFIYFVEYIFSWVTFLHFQDFMIGEYIDRSGNLNDNEAKKELLCSTAIECFLNYMDLGLRLGGGMGDSAARLSFKYQSKTNYFLKLIWDILFHIIVNFILGNIFFGVIVDTFNDLRDLRDKKTEDKNNKCFMCNRDRFDSGYDEDFDYHRNIQHYVFNYVYFFPYLLNKNPQEYTRAEMFAWEQINLKKLDWYPSKPQQKEENEAK